VYFVELQIPARDISASSSQQPEHSVHQHLHHALGQVTRQFFEDKGLARSDRARLPHLMLELSCLSSEPLPTSQAINLQARLLCASEQGFSVNYSFHAQADGRTLAVWRSLHIFYDFELEQALVLETLAFEQGSRSHRFDEPESVRSATPPTLAQTR
jgi:hypothetical protein